MSTGYDHGHGVEPGRPVVTRIVGQKDPALEAARDAGLQVLVGRYSVHKYHESVAPQNLYEIVETPPNLFLTAGVTRLWQLVTGVSAVHIDATVAHLCVGDSDTAPTATDADLIGINKFRELVDGAPVISGKQITYSATFETGDANFAWLEVGVAWASTGANTLVSRAAITSPGLGTKVSTAVWVLNWTLTIN